MKVSTDPTNSDITFSGVLLVGGDVNTSHKYRISKGTFNPSLFALWELTINHLYDNATYTSYVDYCSHDDCVSCKDIMLAGVEISVNAHYNTVLYFSPDELGRGDFSVKNHNNNLVDPIDAGNPSSRSLHIMPSDSTPRNLPDFISCPSITQPGTASAEIKPTRAFGAPQTT